MDKPLEQKKENNRLAMRNKIMALEQKMMVSEGQIEIDPIHHFANNLYARELRLPAGTLLTGKIHKTEHLNILAKGTIAIATEEGTTILTAPVVMVSEPGTKRVGLAQTDVVWVTIHGTEERDLEKLEEQLIAKDFDDPELLAYEAKRGGLCLGQQ